MKLSRGLCHICLVSNLGKKQSGVDGFVFHQHDYNRAEIWLFFMIFMKKKVVEIKNYIKG